MPFIRASSIQSAWRVALPFLAAAMFALWAGSPNQYDEFSDHISRFSSPRNSGLLLHELKTGNDEMLASQRMLIELDTGRIQWMPPSKARYLMNERGDMILHSDGAISLLDVKSRASKSLRKLKVEEEPRLFVGDWLVLKESGTIPAVMDVRDPERPARTLIENAPWFFRFDAFPVNERRFLVLTNNSVSARMYLFSVDDKTREIAHWDVSWNAAKNRSNSLNEFRISNNQVLTRTELGLESHSLDTGELVALPRNPPTALLGVLIDECSLDQSRDGASGDEARRLLYKVDAKNLAVSDADGTILTRISSPNEIIEAAFLRNRQVYVVSNSPWVGIQVHLCSSETGNVVRTIRPNLFRRLMLLVCVGLSVASAVVWWPIISKWYANAWGDIGVIAVIFYVITRESNWWNVGGEAFLLALATVIPSRIVFGKYSLANKLLALVAVQGFLVWLGVQAPFLRFAPFLIVNLFAFALITFLFLRAIGFIGLHCPLAGSSSLLHRFTILDVLKITVAVGLFFLVTKPAGIEFRAWWYDWSIDIVNAKMIVPLAVVAGAATFCGYSRIRWWLRASFFATYVCASCALAYVFIEPVTFRELATHVKLLTLFGSLTWLMIVPFQLRGWRIVFSGRKPARETNSAPFASELTVSIGTREPMAIDLQPI